MKAGLWKLNLVLLAVVGLSACSAGIQLKEEAKSQVGDSEDDLDNDFKHPFNPGDIICSADEAREESFTIDPSSVHGANVLLLLDDSGSMTGEFQKVVLEIQKFIDGITAATNNNYRIGLIFDKTKAAISGRTFYDPQGQPIMNPNPFYEQIQNPNVYYFEKETWSKWADIAFARVFMPADYLQTLPDIIPLDDPNSGSPITLQDCMGPGKYFRPRFNIWPLFGSPACVTAQDKLAIQDYFLSDTTVNIVTVSDDDLNVNFDRENFDYEDPTLNAYPEIVDLMIKDIIRPLGEAVEYKYHSIVGLNAGLGVEVVGTAHMALTKKTSSALHDITTNDWAPLFDSLEEEIIFSEKRANLACRPSLNVEVRFNGVLIEASKYNVLVDKKRIQLLPEAFDGFDPQQSIQVKVSYFPASE